MPILECKSIVKKYPGLCALDKVDLSIEPGRITGLLGPNGSGKTTLIKLMNGLLVPDEGEILINGMQPGPETKKIVSYLPDKQYFNNWMKVVDLVDYYGDFYENFNREKAFDLLKDLDIDFDKKIKTLSKGTKEKVQLILVMSRDAELYVLDEPIGGVDPAARDYILDTILNNYNENASIIISTHLISDIENILDDIIFLKEGKVKMVSSVDDIREQNGKSVDALFREVFKC